MYVDNFFVRPYLLKNIHSFRQKSWVLWRNKNGNMHYWKIQKTDNYKTVSQLTIEP